MKSQDTKSAQKSLDYAYVVGTYIGKKVSRACRVTWSKLSMYFLVCTVGTIVFAAGLFRGIKTRSG